MQFAEVISSLGKYYKTDRGNHYRIWILWTFIQSREKARLISNIVLKSDLFDMPVVGFENHGGRTCIRSAASLLERCLYGSGNDGKSWV